MFSDICDTVEQASVMGRRPEGGRLTYIQRKYKDGDWGLVSVSFKGQPHFSFSQHVNTGS